MSADIIDLPVVTRLDIPTEKVLRAALEKGLEGAVVIGWDMDGEIYFASSYADGPEVLWLLEMTKRNLLNAGSGEE